MRLIILSVVLMFFSWNSVCFNTLLPFFPQMDICLAVPYNNMKNRTSLFEASVIFIFLHFLSLRFNTIERFTLCRNKLTTTVTTVLCVQINSCQKNWWILHFLYVSVFYPLFSVLREFGLEDKRFSNLFSTLKPGWNMMLITPI